MAIEGFGKPRYGFTGSNSWGLKEGDNIYRFMPPMHSLAEKGVWSVYDGTHFGYAGRDPQAPNDPSKTRTRTFLCIEKKGRNGIVEQSCPESERIAEYKAQADAREAELKAAKVPEDQIKTEMSPYVAWLRAHNCSWKHHINAMNEKSEFGDLSIPHRTRKQLDEKFKELREKHNIDPLDPEQGAWINIRRTGKKLDVVDVVEIVQEQVDIGGGRKAFVVKSGAMTPEQCATALEQCRDLSMLGTRLSYEQIERLVACSGDPAEVDAIFGTAGVQEKKSADKAPASSSTKTTASEPTQLPPANVKKDAAPPPAQSEPSPDTAKKAAGLDTTNPAVAKRLAEIQERKRQDDERKKQEQSAAAEAAKVAAAAANDAGAGLSDEEFLALVNKQAQA